MPAAGEPVARADQDHEIHRGQQPATPSTCRRNEGEGRHPEEAKRYASPGSRRHAYQIEAADRGVTAGKTTRSGQAQSGRRGDG